MTHTAENDAPRYDVPIDDETVLRPLSSTPPRELIVWENDDLRASLARGLAQSAAGEVSEYDWKDGATCVHCGEETRPAGDSWRHLHGLYRCQSPDVACGHLAHPVGVPCRADGPNPCLGSRVT
jgi:hypothetical protein